MLPIAEMLGVSGKGWQVAGGRDESKAAEAGAKVT